MSDLNELLDFVKFTHEIRRVRRAVILEDSHQENDAEHSYQLALVAWFIIEHKNLKLNRFRCIGMAMVHDIVEAYAGDVTAFASPAAKNAQEEREKEAIKTMEKDWPSFISLHKLIKEYEEHKTPEGKFVYALDKLMPAINNYMFGGTAWKNQGVNLEWVKKIKKGKTEMSPIVESYYQELLKIMEKKPGLFAKATK